MAFNINPGKQQFSATAAQTVFTFNFAIFAGTDLKVYKTLAGAVANDTTDLLTLSTHYTVSINGTLGGTVTLLLGASLNDTITVVRSLPIARTTDYVTNGDLYAEILDLDQDYQTYLVLDQNVQLERAIIMPESLASIDLNIPAPVANSYLRWNVTANALENDTSIPDDVVTTTANVALTNADVISTHADVIAASASATSSQLRAWEAEAEKLTADSYATEPENVFVKTYVSDGDGTFTATNTSEYSALHWSYKALINANFAPAINSATAKTTPADADKFGIWDSVSGLLNSVSWAGIKANLPTTTNLLINSNGLVNQRGYVSATATTGANQYTVDRWRVVTSGQNLTFAATNGVTTFTAPAGGVEQVIENLNVLGGSYVLTIGGTATALVAESADNVTYTTLTPTNGIYTVTGGKYVKVTFSSGTFSLPQFERGTIATPYEFRKFGGELQACQRYLPVIYFGGGYIFTGQAISTTSAYSTIPFPITARANPTGIIFDGTISFTASNGNPTGGTIVLGNTTKSEANVISSGAAGLVAGNASSLQGTATKIYFTGCEL